MHIRQIIQHVIVFYLCQFHIYILTRVHLCPGQTANAVAAAAAGTMYNILYRAYLETHPYL